MRSETRPSAARATLVVALVLAALARLASGATIQATQEENGTIRVVAPGRFETTATARKGFGATFFDLKHDPEKRRDLAPVADENGLLWTKTRGANVPGDGSWYANPPEKVELLETGPVRARVRLSGWHRKYGKTRPEDAWKVLGFEQTFTVHPTGSVCVDYALIAPEPVPLHHFLLIIKSTGAWGNNGKGEGRGEAHCAAQHGEARPSFWDKTQTPFALQWSNGPTYFQDILMAIHGGLYGGSYWNEGFQDKDLRAGLDLLSRWPDKTIPKGKTHVPVLLRFDWDMNSPDAARPFAEDYRSPDRLDVTEGRFIGSDDGDHDADGFNESEGCHVLEAGPTGVAFTLHGAKTPRCEPVLKVKSWNGPVPDAIAWGGSSLALGRDFNASLAGGLLLVQVLRVVREDTRVTIAQERGVR